MTFYFKSIEAGRGTEDAPSRVMIHNLSLANLSMLPAYPPFENCGEKPFPTYFISLVKAIWQGAKLSYQFS